jgi:amino acid transporter
MLNWLNLVNYMLLFVLYCLASIVYIMIRTNYQAHLHTIGGKSRPTRKFPWNRDTIFMKVTGITTSFYAQPMYVIAKKFGKYLQCIDR